MRSETLEPAATCAGSPADVVLAIDVGGTNLKMGLFDLAGGLLFNRTVPSGEIGRGDAAILRLAALARGMIEESGLPRARIRGAGLVVPGVTDPGEGIVSLAPAFGWQALPIRDRMSAELGVPVYVENDANAAALAEKQWGAGREFRDFVFLSIGTGIGAGLILDGRLHRGHRHAAGEVGHVIVNLDWVRRRAARHGPLTLGCLENLAGAPGMVRWAEELGGLKGWSAGQRTEHTAEEVFAAARAGDPVALQVLDGVTDCLAVGIVDIAVIVSPEAVIVGGGVARAGDALLAPLSEKVAAWSPIRPRILQSSMGAEAGLVGAASLVACNAGAG